tara:strand:+ start:15600 stop:17036 length:1437 start_codon:yes stop_codon:yes gene_type:complete
MAGKTETLTLKVQSDIGATTKDVQGLASEFKIMGVSLNTLKSSFASMGKIAKASFATITKGIMSTGIGALLIAFGSLVTFLTKTKKGAELLEVAFAGISATFNVLVDRVSKFGGAIVKLFQGDTKGALQDVKSSFVGIGDEIRQDTKDAIALKQAFVNLRDSQRELNVETARQRAEIERLKLIAEDVTKSEQERLEAAQSAFNIENKLLDRRVANARENLRIIQEENAIGQSMAEDLDKEAQAEIDLFNIQAESTTKQIELNNKINAIKKEAETKRQQELDDLKKLDEHQTEYLKRIPVLTQESNNEIIKSNYEVELNRKKDDETDKKRKKMMRDFGKSMALSGLEIVKQTAGEGSRLSKQVAIAQATISGGEAVLNAFKTASDSPFNTLIPGYNFIQAGLAATFAAIQVDRIISGSKPDASAGSGGGESASPRPSLVSGAFDLSGVDAPEPVQAFVVTDDVSQSQDKLSTIRRRSTI